MPTGVTHETVKNIISKGTLTIIYVPSHNKSSDTDPVHSVGNNIADHYAVKSKKLISYEPITIEVFIKKDYEKKTFEVINENKCDV